MLRLIITLLLIGSSFSLCELSRENISEIIDMNLNRTSKVYYINITDYENYFKNKDISRQYLKTSTTVPERNTEIYYYCHEVCINSDCRINCTDTLASDNPAKTEHVVDVYFKPDGSAATPPFINLLLLIVIMLNLI